MENEQVKLLHDALSRYSRCCDLHPDGLGQYACQSCISKTFAMMGEATDILGIAKDGLPQSNVVAIAEARVRRAASELLAALQDVAHRLDLCKAAGVGDATIAIDGVLARTVRAAIAKAK